MSRRSRVVIPDSPHHITQRGNNRRDVFFNKADRDHLKLLQHYCSEFGVRVSGDCLMTDHVHIMATPPRESALADAFGRTHNDYSRWGSVTATKTNEFLMPRQ